MEGPDSVENQDFCLAVAQEQPTLWGGGFETTRTGGRLMSVMWDPRDGNPHLLRLPRGPVSMELYLRGFGACMAGPRPRRVPRILGEPDREEWTALLDSVCHVVLDLMVD